MSSFFDTPDDDSAPPSRHRSSRPRRRWIWVTLALIGLTVVGARAAVIATRHSPLPAALPAAQTATPDSPGATVPTPATETSFTASNGRVMNLAAWQGKPFVLWFIGASCSSCAISVPTMVKHLPTFAASGVHVVAVDLYGDLPPGSQGLRYLRQFGGDTAGAHFADRAWTWGLASEQLSYRYDPTGTPDLYFVIDKTGRVAYRGSVPVSTIGSLLEHVKLVAGATPASTTRGSSS